MKNPLFLLLLLFTFHSSFLTLKAQAPASSQYNANTRFEQMGTQLPTPNNTRTASGAPGKDYWQNRVDYDIKVELAGAWAFKVRNEE